MPIQTTYSPTKVGFHWPRKSTDKETAECDLNRQKISDRLNEGLVIGGAKFTLRQDSYFLSDKHAKTVGLKMFASLAVDKRAITVASFMKYFDSKEEADEVFMMFDRGGKRKLNNIRIWNIKL
jgi:hypothetical protein